MMNSFSECKNCGHIFHDEVIWRNDGKCPFCESTEWEDV